jgi:tRNA-specific 2-thiouridylase
MSGGVDSSVAAALLKEQGHEVVGVTMRLWGGESDSGCCSVSDVDDARRVAQQLGIDHLVFNFTDDFHRNVVEPYVSDHAVGITPNPCIECNRHLKFERLHERARVLGFDAVATGHHARVTEHEGRLRLERGFDAAKDQSYVVYMLDQERLRTTILPVGSMTKAEVREAATRLGLRTAHKPDSQDVCFITSGRAVADGAAGTGDAGRSGFLARRIPLHAADVVTADGDTVGRVDAVELVTLGQRRGVAGGGGTKRFVIDVDVVGRRVVVGPEESLLVTAELVDSVTWSDRPVEGEVLVQCSAHGTPHAARISSAPDGATSRVRVEWAAPQRRVSPGQAAVFYDPTDRFVLGGGTVVKGG